MIVGLTQYTSKAHLCRATLEAVSFQTKEIMESMIKDSGFPINILRVDGGMCASDELMQIQADISGVEIDRPEMLEITAFGAAFAAGLAVGTWKTMSDFKTESMYKKFNPKICETQRNDSMKGWRRALEKSMNLA